MCRSGDLGVRQAGSDARAEAANTIIGREAEAAAAAAKAGEVQARSEAEASLRALAAFRPALVRIEAAAEEEEDAASQAGATAASRTPAARGNPAANQRHGFTF